MAGGQQVVRLFGGVRPNGAGQWVRVERRDPGNGAWTPVPVAGSDTCDGSTNFRTDAEGWFLRAAAYDGPASYRMSRLRPDGSWENGVEIPVGAPAAPTVPPTN